MKTSTFRVLFVAPILIIGAASVYLSFVLSWAFFNAFIGLMEIGVGSWSIALGLKQLRVDRNSGKLNVWYKQSKLTLGIAVVLLGLNNIVGYSVFLNRHNFIETLVRGTFTIVLSIPMFIFGILAFKYRPTILIPPKTNLKHKDESK